MLTGQALIRDVQDYAPAPGALSFWWLGQMGFILKSDKVTVAVDPYLDGRPPRLVPPLVTPEELASCADYVLGTHDHLDHIDRAAWQAIAAANERVLFVAPKLLVSALSDALGIPPERFIGMDDGTSYEDFARGFTLTGIASAHEFLDRDPATGMYPYMGYIMTLGGKRVYHSGDSCKYEGLETKLIAAAPLDIMFIPINGRDALRYRQNCIGNMDFREAVDLAGMVKPALVVPGHYEMFQNNSENPALFAAYLEAKYPERAFWIGGHGVRVGV